MRFEVPWIWYGLPLVLAWLAWLSRRSYAQLVPPARWGSLAARLVIMLCLFAGLSRPIWFGRSQRQHVIFAADVSPSVTAANIEAGLAEVDRLARETFDAYRDARVSVVAFGRRPELIIRSAATWSGWPADVREKLSYQTTLPECYSRRTALIGSQGHQATELDDLDRSIAAIERFRDETAGDRTDAEKALRLALNCGDAAEQRTIFLLSDGRFNTGQWRRAWSAVRTTRASVRAVMLNKPPPPEVAAVDIVLPSAVRINQGFGADVRISSTVATTARVLLFKDGFSFEERDVELRPGDNVVSIANLYFQDKGFHNIEAVVRARDDTQLQNNTVKSIVVVPGEARVLYVDSDERQIPYLKSALELEGMQVEARPAGGVPQTLSELLSFDAFILCNVPADRLSLRQMQLIRTYVQEMGGGFMMLGGTESFGLGGYYSTPIEEILPVRMPIQKEMTRPSLALALVIDKSGSMEGVKIQLAKRAAQATADTINPRDLIAVIGFDGESRVLLELTPAADRETISSRISTLDAGGGTFLYPALEDAHDRLVASNARRKHVIVLSDGQTQGFGYEERVSAMAADGITLSSVGIGEDADMRLMEAIALAGGGRAYFTNDYYSIPQIFTREALRASNSMLVERLVQPVVVGDDVCLRDIDADELPLLSGYVATTPKPQGNLILASDSGDPLLAKWRCGLGRTAAFTSETKPRWAEDWIQWEDFAKFWSQLVRSITGDELARTVTVECGQTAEGEGVRLTADVRDAAGGFASDAELELTALDESGRSVSLDVLRTGPGLFGAFVPKLVFGREHQFLWRIRHGGQEHAPVSFGFVYSFSPEFRTHGTDDEVFEHMQRFANTDVTPVGETRLNLPEPTAESWRQLWPYLLGIAVLLVPIDILIRRLG